MKKKEFMKLYDELGDSEIDELYMFSCLKTSRFEKEKAYKLKGLLKELWLKDENNYSISFLSDMLYNIYDDIKDNIDELSTRDILAKMYEREYYSSSDDEGIYY